jgi:hypothetical protein
MGVMGKEGLMSPIRFNGILKADSQELSVNFYLHIDKSGEVIFKFDEIPLNDETMFIKFNQFNKNEMDYFSVEAKSDDSSIFYTKDLYFSSRNLSSNNGSGSVLNLDGNCVNATIRRKLVSLAKLPQIRLYLKGFQCFGSLSEKCDLGVIFLAGQNDIDDHNKITGYIAIQSEIIPDDLILWKNDAGKLIEHVRRVMSFASGIYLRSPATDFFYNDTVETTLHSQSSQGKPDFPSMHFLNLDNIFKSAVHSYFDMPIKVDNLFFAIEWFSMKASYNEIRLVNAMTALENLIDSNLTKQESFFFSNSSFEKKKSSMKKIIVDKVGEWFPNAEKLEFVSELNAKIMDLNRRPLRQKLKILSDRWEVPMDGISDAMIASAISARNHVIHRGSYYENGKDKPELWVHVTVIREIIARFIMKIIGYKGQYISFLGGYHMTKFPIDSIQENNEND